MLALVIFVPVLILLAAGYFFFCVFMMLRNVSPGRLRLAALLPLALFDKSLFNKTGNVYRRRALTIDGILIVLVLVLVGVAR